MNITDVNLDYVNYTINQGINYTLLAPWNISTDDWVDGSYILDVNAFDYVGNISSETYQFTLDSIKPTIELISPSNNSYIKNETQISFNISDINIESAIYSVNNNDNSSFGSPYNINISSWIDGTYSLEVYAIDLAGNNNLKNYTFYVDKTKPEIINTFPSNASTNISGDTPIYIEFSEAMDIESVLNSINFYPDFSNINY